LLDFVLTKPLSFGQTNRKMTYFVFRKVLHQLSSAQLVVDTLLPSRNFIWRHLQDKDFVMPLLVWVEKEFCQSAHSQYISLLSFLSMTSSKKKIHAKAWLFPTNDVETSWRGTK
jgi:hypothetical protein